MIINWIRQTKSESKNYNVGHYIDKRDRYESVMRRSTLFTIVGEMLTMLPSYFITLSVSVQLKEWETKKEPCMTVSLIILVQSKVRGKRNIYIYGSIILTTKGFQTRYQE